MGKDRLFVREHRYGYQIAWFLAEEQDEGAIIGDGDKTYTAADLANAEATERDHIIACMTAAKTDGVTAERDGFTWEKRSQAQAALRMINLAIKTDGGAPWPEWAIKAKAAGWTSPKGWKPS